MRGVFMKHADVFSQVSDRLAALIKRKMLLAAAEGSRDPYSVDCEIAALDWALRLLGERYPDELATAERQAKQQLEMRAQRRDFRNHFRGSR